ncbi:hypothetical protein HDV02_004009 [Globomyces sp. JEL0801]|nr:hypothetical protein HDV02_004009 [Globomyces sp. JEL0801]
MIYILSCFDMAVLISILVLLIIYGTRLELQNEFTWWYNCSVHVLYALLIALCLGNAIIIGSVQSDLLGSTKAAPQPVQGFPKTPVPLITDQRQSKPVADQLKKVSSITATYQGIKPATQKDNPKPISSSTSNRPSNLNDPSNPKNPATTSTPNLCLSKAIATWNFAGSYLVPQNTYLSDPITISSNYVRAFMSDTRFSMYVADSNGYIYTDPGCICEDKRECVLDCPISRGESLILIPRTKGSWGLDVFDPTTSSNYLSRAGCGPSNSAKVLNPCFALLPLILAIV